MGKIIQIPVIGLRRCRFVVALLLGVCLLEIAACHKDDNKPQDNRSDDSHDSTDVGRGRKTRNLVVVTLDGYRWEEVFRGADSSLFFSDEFISQDMGLLKDRFWGATQKERREALMPFFWNYIAKNGKLYGNRDLGCKVNVRNPYWVSYPGYNEIWTGYPDPAINSNDYGDNPNYNLLETLNAAPGYEGQVAAFTTWKKFWEILNHRRSKFYQVSGEDSLKALLNEAPIQSVFNQMNANLDFYNYGREDALDDRAAYAVAKTYLRENHPRVLYVAFGHTDDLGHAGLYDCYLEEGHNIDAMISDLWDEIQGDPFYKDSTTLFITCDHGRGIGYDWKGHGTTHPGSDETWCAIISPDTKPLGEINKNVQLYQNQYAMSLSAFLGINFSNSTNQSIGTIIKEFMDND